MALGKLQEGSWQEPEVQVIDSDFSTKVIFTCTGIYKDLTSKEVSIRTFGNTVHI